MEEIGLENFCLVFFSFLRRNVPNGSNCCYHCSCWHKKCRMSTFTFTFYLRLSFLLFQCVRQNKKKIQDCRQASFRFFFQKTWKSHVIIICRVEHDFYLEVLFPIGKKAKVVEYQQSMHSSKNRQKANDRINWGCKQNIKCSHLSFQLVGLNPAEFQFDAKRHFHQG